MNNDFRVADETCYPYEASVGRCRAKKNDNLRTMQCEVPENRQTEALYKTGPAYSLNNETDIMWEIFHYGPVQGNEIRARMINCIVQTYFYFI